MSLPNQKEAHASDVKTQTIITLHCAAEEKTRGKTKPKPYSQWAHSCTWEIIFLLERKSRNLPLCHLHPPSLFFPLSSSLFFFYKTLLCSVSISQEIIRRLVVALKLMIKVISFKKNFFSVLINKKLFLQMYKCRTIMTKIKTTKIELEGEKG